MKRVIAYIIILALIGGGIYWYISQKRQDSIVHYNAVAVEKGDVEQTFTATGTLTAVTAVNVGSEVSGVIQTLYVEHNSLVKKGQLMAQLNPETLQAQVDKAKASLSKSQSSYNSQVANAEVSRSNVKKSQADLLASKAKAKQAEASIANARAVLSTNKANVNNARANIRKAKAELENAKTNYLRMASLLKEDLIAQNEYDDAYTTYKSSQATVEGLEASLESSKANLEGAQASLDSAIINLSGILADVQAAEISVESANQQLVGAQASVIGAKADVDQAKASLESAEVDLSKTSIRSPIDGVVLSVLVSEGQTVAAQYQAPELFVLAKNLNEMQVETNVDEADVGQIMVGNTAKFTVDAWQTEEFEGKVTEVRKSAETTNNVVTYPIIVSCGNPGMRLMPGMTATVTISTRKSSNVLLVPNLALRFKPDETAQITPSPNQDSPKGENAHNEDTITKDKENKKPKDHSLNAQDKDYNLRTIYTLVPDNPGELVSHKVTIGLSDGTNSEIMDSNLKEGDMVVTGVADTQQKKSSRNNRRGGPPF